jgi:hypothetical protein
MVVIIDSNQVAQLKMTCHTSSLTSNTLHSTSISKEGVYMMVDQLKPGLIENSSGMLLGDGKTNSIAETLTKRSSCDFDSRGIVSFGMTGCNAVNLLKLHQ